jgi:hypothetical protein
MPAKKPSLDEETKEILQKLSLYSEQIKQKTQPKKQELLFVSQTLQEIAQEFVLLAHQNPKSDSIKSKTTEIFTGPEIKSSILTEAKKSFIQQTLNFIAKR